MFRSLAKENGWTAVESGVGSGGKREESGRSINNGAKAVDGKLERALNRVQAYVKARRYT